MPEHDETSTPTDPTTAASEAARTRTRTRSRSRTAAGESVSASAAAAAPQADPTPTDPEPAKKVAKKAAKKVAKKSTAKKATTADDADAATPSGEDAPAKKVAKKTAKKAATTTPAKKAAADAPAKKATKKAATRSSAVAEDGADAVAAEAPAAPDTTEATARPARRSRRRTPTAGDTAGDTADTGDDTSSAAATAAGRADGTDDPTDARGVDGTEDGEGSGAAGATGSSRRRRRGGRGRRGRGGRGGADRAGAPSADGSDASGPDTTDVADADEDGADQDAVAGGRTRSTSRTRGGGRSKEVRATGDEPRIAPGGTRIAAKKSRRGGSGGGGGGANGGGGGRRHARPGGVTEEERRAIMAGPPRTMLVTARPQRTQIAVMEDRTLVEHYVTRDEDVTFVGNIYMGRVQNVLPGMEAAFIDIGKGRNGVLYAGEVLYDELDLDEESDQRIENVLKPGQKVLVQVTKDPMGTKGPRLTMHLSLAGRYVVLAPNSNVFGISRKLTDTERDRLRRIVKAAKPEGHGVIVRTAAENAQEEALTADVERLVARWEKVEAAAQRAKPLEAVYEEPKLVVKVIRDIFGPDFVRCIVDEETLFDQVRDYLGEVAPDLVERIELYGAPTDDVRSQAAGAPSLESAAAAAQDEAEGGAPAAEVTPQERRRDLPGLFSAFDVTDQLKQATHRKVWLPSGGYLIIESTEAMKVIDVNTGKFTGGSDSNLEEVVLKTNLEAADEIVRQLRLRDMGGMIIIDFIDMLLRSNQEQVVRRLKRELLRDRTKTRVSDVSRLGLVQMTRKNVSQGLVESFSTKCETCDGHGFLTDLS
jgi:Rne/Rng family ribonuclease